jgi:hypothetical protein
MVDLLLYFLNVTEPVFESFDVPFSGCKSLVVFFNIGVDIETEVFFQVFDFFYTFEFFVDGRLLLELRSKFR